MTPWSRHDGSLHSVVDGAASGPPPCGVEHYGSVPHPTMAGLQDDTPIPTALTVHQQSRALEIAYADGTVYRLPFEFLRVLSPSAEVQGHGPGQETLQTGKREVGIVEIEAVGHYAIQPTFSDGHSSGLYAWDYLHHLARNQDALWRAHLDRLAAAGLDRDAPMKEAASASGGSCGSGGCSH